MSAIEVIGRLREEGDLPEAVPIIAIFAGPQSPVNGVAVGAVRPLKDINLPFFSDLDRALRVVQTGAASVRVSGTLAEYESKLVPFAEISSAFHRLITGSPN